MKRCVFPLLSKAQQLFPNLFINTLPRYYHEIPFFQLYHRITGKSIPKSSIPKLKKKHPNLDIVSQEQLQCTLQILQKFGITPLEACENPHLFSMNPISMDNYGEILKECGFYNIAPLHIISPIVEDAGYTYAEEISQDSGAAKYLWLMLNSANTILLSGLYRVYLLDINRTRVYHTIVRSRTIGQLKKDGLIAAELKLEDVLHNCFKDWPEKQRTFKNFPETTTSILTIRVYVLENYLQWRLSVTEEQFKKYCKHYLPLKHRPMSDIKEALNIALNDIKFDVPTIRRNGFIISSDPVNTKLILENVNSLAGLDIRAAIRIEPGIMKNNYNSLLQIKKILEEFQISDETQRHSMRIYCMCPDTVRERLLDLSSLKECNVLFSNRRVLSMVVHKVKVMNRLQTIQKAKKQCYSLNHLVGSSNIFNSYINNFGNKTCGRDIAILISSSLGYDKNIVNKNDSNTDFVKTEFHNILLSRLRKHKYWLHTALNVIDENIQFLKRYFNNNAIFKNCHLLLYPTAELRNYIVHLLEKRHNGNSNDDLNNIELDHIYNTLNYKLLTDDQLLSLVLYEIEKKHHFSGDGIWNKQLKTDNEELHEVKQNCVL